ncbi:MAG: cytochrome c oxidase subunit II [Actinomycetes bacterium]
MGNKRKATVVAVISTLLVLVFGWLLIRNIGVPDGRPLTTLSPQGEKSQDIQNLIIPVFIVAGLVFVLVEVGIIWMVARFRRNKSDVDGEDEPEQVHGNTPLEIGWTVVPAVLLAVLAVFNVKTIVSMDDYSKDALKVTVVGQQWWWEYRYDTNNDGVDDIITATEAAIPTGRDVRFSIQSNDVIHSFWIPALNGKKDAVPGRTHQLVLQAKRPGIYQGQCTEYCGLSHGVMRMQVKALRPADYDAWVSRMTTPPAQPTTEDAKAGQEIFVAQCARCHQVNGLVPTSKAPFKYSSKPVQDYGKLVKTSLASGNAPNLTHFMMRDYFIGGLYPLYLGNEEYRGDNKAEAVPSGVPNTNQIKAWLRNPAELKPMNPDNNQGMPNLGLAEQQIDQLTAYLLTLK